MVIQTSRSSNVIDLGAANRKRMGRHGIFNYFPLITNSNFGRYISGSFRDIDAIVARK